MKYLKISLGLLVSLVCIWWALRGIDLGLVWQALGRAQPGWLALALLIGIPILLLKTWRWQTLFYPDQNRRFSGLLNALLIGIFWSSVLPARLGEVARIYVAGRAGGNPVKVVSTVLLEKILDILTIVGLLLVVLPFIQVPDLVRNSAFGLGAGVILAFLLCLLFSFRPAWSLKFIGWWLRPLPQIWQERLLKVAEGIIQSLRVLHHPTIAVRLFGQSIVIWSLSAVQMLMLAWVVDLALNLPQATLVTVVTNLGMAIPSSPGYVGVYEASLQFSLNSYFPGQEALVLSYALLSHAVGLLPYLLIGAILSAREGVSLNQVREARTGTAGVAKLKV